MYGIFKVIFILLLIFNLCLLPAFSKTNVKKKENKKSSDTVTLSKKQYDQMIKNQKSLQDQINSLRSDLNMLKQEKAAASQSAPAPSENLKVAENHESASQENAKPEGSKETLEQLQKEMENPEHEVPAPSAPGYTSGNTVTNPKISVIGDFVWNADAADNRLDVEDAVGGMPVFIG